MGSLYLEDFNELYDIQLTEKDIKGVVVTLCVSLDMMIVNLEDLLRL